MSFIYLNNPNLRAAGVPYPYKQKEIDEFIRCKNDPIYFIEKYIKIVSVDDGLVPCKLRPYQKEMVMSFIDNRKTIAKCPRQSGKTTSYAVFLCWYIIFNADINVAILANKASTARQILARVKLAYEHLPKFLQQGVESWNRGSIELENNARISAHSTSSSAIRGESLNCLILDEFAAIGNNIAEEFFTSVYPTISSGKTSKIIITSTPLGYNHFYKLWTYAEQGLNDFHPIQFHWSQVPGYDEEWKRKTIADMGEDKFTQEFETEFLGSSNTLIHSRYIKNMVPSVPIHKNLEGLTIYQEPIKRDPNVYNDPKNIDHNYLVVADPSEGTGNDDHGVIVYDITDYPIKIVAKFQNNTLSHLVLPLVLEKLAKTYNEAHVLIETNNNGQQVADTLYRDIEYENVCMFEGGKIGIKTTVSSKRNGCSLFKDMVEGQKLIINDLELKSQISTFIRRKNNTWGAEDGCHDDLVMCCVLLAYFAATDDFKHLTDKTLRQTLLEQKSRSISEEVMPFGFICDGSDPFSFNPNTEADEDDDGFSGFF